MTDLSQIGKRIRELRKEKGLTQKDLADELQVSFQAVSNWERNVAPPDIENLIRMASYFGLLVDDLLRPKNDDLFLGIDGGGTKTEFVLVNSDGYVVNRFRKGGCNPNDIGYAAMATLLINGIEEILVGAQTVKSCFLGLAGISVGDYATRLLSDLKKRFSQIKFKVENDSFNLFALHEDADMAVISGTGSVVFVRNGQTFQRLGGWGYLLDHAGSAYDIGRSALREALAEEDRKEKHSLLYRLLRKKLNTPTVWEQVNTIYREGRPYIAGLAPIVLEAYKKGDPKATQILNDTAKALAELLNEGIRLYGARRKAIASGGLFQHFPDILIPLIRKYCKVQLTVNLLPPVYGACRNACKNAGFEMPDYFSDNFEKTYGGIEL